MNSGCDVHIELFLLCNVFRLLLEDFKEDFVSEWLESLIGGYGHVDTEKLPGTE